MGTNAASAETSPRVEISKGLVFVNSASSFVTRLLSVSVLIWLQQYLLRRITPEEYSLLPVLYSVMMFAPLITIVLTAGLGRYIVEAYARNDDERVTQIVSTMFPLLCAAGLVFLAGGWTFAWYIDHFLNIAPNRLWDARIMMAMLMFSAAVRLPLAPFGIGLYVRQKFVLQNVINVGAEVFRLTLLFALLLGVSPRVLWVVTASVAAELLNLAFTQAFSRHLVPSLRFSLLHRRWPIAREITGFGGWNFINGLFGSILQAADPLILNRLASPVDVSCFYLGSLPIRQFKMLYAGLTGSLEPVVFSIYATGQDERLADLFLRMGRFSLWCSLFVAAPFMILGNDLIVLYVGKTYVQAAVVMLLLFAYFPIAYGNLMLWPIASAKVRLRPIVWRTVLENSLNLALTLYLVGSLKLGAKGSALGSLISVCICHVFLWWPLAARLLNLRAGRILSQTIIPGVSPFLVAVSVMLGCRIATAPPPQWTYVFMIGLAGATAYVLSVLFALKHDDRSDLARIGISTLSYFHGDRALAWLRKTEQSI